MLLDIVKKGSTDRSVVLRIIDSTDGTPETGVVYNTAGIDLWYRREGAVKTSITEVTLAALTTAHADGGFLAVGDGYYRLDLPDAAFATGANYVDVGGTVTGMVVIGGRVRLVDVDIEDGVRAGLTALPNAAVNAAGGLVKSTAGGVDMDALAADAARLTAARAGALTDWIDGGRLDTILDTAAADVANIDGAAMRGTDSAALASVCTEGRLAELDAANLPTDVAAVSSAIAALNDFDPATQTVDVGKILGTALAEDAGTLATSLSFFLDVATPGKTMNDVGVAGAGLSAADVWTYGARTVGTVTLCVTNADMRGTDGANTTKTGYSLAASSLTSGVFAAGAVNAGVLSGSAGTEIGSAVWAHGAKSVGTVTLCVGNSDMRGTDGANTVVPPSVAQFNARTLVAADYFSPSADTIQVGGTSKTGYSLAAGSLTSGTLAAGAINAAAIASTAGAKLADISARRTLANIEASSDGDTLSLRSRYGAASKLTNKIAISGTTLTVYRSNDTTVLGTQSVTTSVTANPITALDTD